MSPGELQRFRAKITIDRERGCWLWTGTVNKLGYAYFRVGSKRDGTRRTDSVHRISYEHYVGPIPTKCHLHHICEVRRCANAFHLRPVTSREHQAIHAEPLSATCGQGHLLTPDTIYIRPDGTRRCAICTRERSLRHKAETRTTCKHGHAFTPENTINQSGRRYCRTCRERATKRPPRTHCRRGHALNGDNVKVLRREGRNDELVCLTCANLRSRAYVERQREHEPNRRWRAYKRPPDGDQVEVTS